MPSGNNAIQAETAHLISHAKAEHLQIQILVKDILAMLSPLTIERRVQLQNRLPDTLPSVLAPRTVLRQAIFELLVYALDVAAAGQLVLQASVDQTLNLSIWAKGAESTERRSTASLDVSQSLLSGLSANLTITSLPGVWQGIVQLPVITPHSILVIDDNSSLVELFRRYVAGRPYYLHHVYTVGEALDYAGQNKIRLILLDIMMPEQDGWEVLQQLQRYAALREIPIIICSVIHEPEIAKMLGAADYLVKPVLPDDLLKKIEVWCDG
jgi:CheY-like chemotaxis protein